MLLPRLFALLIALLGSPAWAEGLTLEGGFLLSYNIPAAETDDIPFGELGFRGQVNYGLDRWELGVRGWGAISNNTSLDIHNQSITLHGTLRRRQYAVEGLVRYFLTDPRPATGKTWYLEFGIMALQTDFVAAENVYVLPQSTDYTRIFIQGSAFTLGAGFRPKNGPWNYQINYRLDRYETLLVTGEVNYLHPVLLDEPIENRYFIHVIQLSVGLDVFGS